MAKKEKSQSKFSFYKLCGKISDILFIPILLVSLFSSTFMLIQKRQNKPTSFFGLTLVNILSGSMTDAGLKRGDTVLTKNCNVFEVALGDVIAFYEVRNDPTDKAEKHLIQKYENPETIKKLNPSNNILYGDENITITTYPKVQKEGAYNVEYAQKNKRRVIFHMVIGIYVDEDGSIFYETKGTNSSVDPAPIRSDFIVGKYVNTPRVFRDIMSFCGSSMGMIIMVCAPLCILILFQCLSLIKQVEIIYLEKQLISGKKRYDDEDVSTTLNGNDIETHNKVYLYFLTDKQERQMLLNYMWDDILFKEKPSTKESKLLETLNDANSKLEKSNKAYWETWINGTKGYTNKKIKKYYEEAFVNHILSSSAKKENSIKIEKNNANISNDDGSKYQQMQQKDIEQTINKVAGKSSTTKSVSTKSQKNSTSNVAKNQKTNAPSQVEKTVSTSTTKDESKTIVAKTTKPSTQKNKPQKKWLIINLKSAKELPLQIF